MSANDLREQVQIEVFLLQPDDGEDAEAIGRRAEAARTTSRGLSDEHRALLAQQQQASLALRQHTEDARRQRERKND
jgi:hypothetical protein